MHLRSIALGCLASLALRADGLSELKARLQSLKEPETVKVSVDRQIWKRTGDVKKPIITQGRVNAWVEDGPQGLRIFWAHDLVQRALQEARAKALDPEKTTPVRQAMGSLDAPGLQEYLNAAPQLLETLEQAKLLEDRADTLDGKPARLFVFKLEPKISAQEKKYVKELDATGKIWLGVDGYPLAAEEQVHVKGRAFVVVSFQSDEKETYRFERVGRRLIAVHHAREVSGSGGGENSQERQLTTLKVN